MRAISLAVGLAAYAAAQFGTIQIDWIAGKPAVNLLDGDEELDMPEEPVEVAPPPPHERRDGRTLGGSLGCAGPA